MSKCKNILIVGGPDDEQVYIGVFNSPAEAAAYAKVQCKGETWTVVPLEPRVEDIIP